MATYAAVIRRLLLCLALLHALLARSPLAAGASLKQITSFGPNPTNATFYLYEPAGAVARAPLLVFPHWCHGTALDAFSSKPWRAAADRLGFLTVYPSSPWAAADGCWDVSSPGTLRHDGGGDSLAIASMVRWTLANRDVDPARVFAAGVSSGAMMTNVLLAAYPDLFAAGSAQAGVPFGCFAAPAELANSKAAFDYWSDACAKGKVVKTAQQWAADVHAAYPDYAGPRPKMQVMHGTADEVLNVQNYYEEIKMWTAVLGIDGTTPQSVVPNSPQGGWTKNVYGTKGLFEAFLAQGVSHNIPDQADEIIRFFGLNCTGSACFSRKSLNLVLTDSL